MKKVPIEKNSVQETLIIPLYARKLCTELYPDLFRDEKALDLIERLDYDFSSVEKKSKTLMHRFGALEVAMRQRDLAWEIKDYLKTRPEASVVNLGCGLDQTGETLDNGTCRIYNVDFPEVISIRNELLPPGERTKNIPRDLMDTRWFREVEQEKGLVFFAAGVFYYFTKEQVMTLFSQMAKHFPQGRVVFDGAGKTAVKMMMKTWVKQAGIEKIDAYFSIEDVEKEMKPRLKGAKITSKGYMLGYHDLKVPSVSGLFRLLSRIGDEVMKMSIVKVEFSKEQ